MRWRRLVAAAAVAVAAAGCGQIPAGDASEQARKHFGPPPQPGTGPMESTQGGRFPLGPSTTTVGPTRLAEQPRPILSLDGTVPAELVRPSPQPLFEAQRRPSMGNMVVTIPGVPDRRGHGLSARNGTNLQSVGAAVVAVRDFNNPTELTGTAAALPPAGTTGEGLGGAGAAGQQPPAGGQQPAGGEEAEGAQQAPQRPRR